MDDLSAPLGQADKRKTKFSRLTARLPFSVPQGIAGGLALFIAVVAGWALTVDDPLGGEPMVVVSASKGAGSPSSADTPGAAGQRRYDGPAHVAGKTDEPPAGSHTINIIDGASGKSQQVVLPGTAGDTAASPIPGADAGLLEKTRHGDVPRIAANGARPSATYARAVPPLAEKSGAPRIALIVTGLGISSKATAAALAKLPGAVTFAFVPYGEEIDRLAARARADGHELLLQAPMEPQDYPDNDPGPQTLLTSLTADQNIDRLQWLMSRFHGFVGIANFMGSRFTASEQSLAPILREANKRGLIYVDDGSSARSVASQISGATQVPFAKADLAIDAVPTAVDIDRALSRLETQARERGFAVGTLSALPTAIKRVADWSAKVESRGFVLVPITAVAVKPKSS